MNLSWFGDPLDGSAKMSGFLRLLAFFIAAISISSSLSFAQPTTQLPAEQDPAMALTGLAAQVVSIRRVFTARTDLDATQKAAINLRLDKINEAIGRLRVNQPKIKAEETSIFASAISEDTAFLSGLADAAAAELLDTLDVLIGDLSAKAADRKGSGAYGAKSLIVHVEVRAIDSRNRNQKVPILGLRVGAVTMARSKRGCLDHRFSRLTSPAIEPLFSAAFQFCLYKGDNLVAKTTWIRIGLDGKPRHIVEIPVP